MHTHTYIHVCMYMHMRVHTHMYTIIYMHACMCAHMPMIAQTTYAHLAVLLYVFIITGDFNDKYIYKDFLIIHISWHCIYMVIITISICLIPTSLFFICKRW